MTIPKTQFEYFASFAGSNIDFSGFDTVFCGFSGGADSTALLIGLKELSQTAGFKLNAVHFEHGLRGLEGINDAKWCRTFCRKYSIPFMEFKLDIRNNKRPDESIEQAARRLRIERWKELTKHNIKSAVALAHHSDDKIENMFLRLCRGSNSSGLTSLRNKTVVDGICFIRPLLAYSRKQIENLLISAGIKAWRTDSSNADNAYKRNFLRNSILPEIRSNIPASGHGLVNAYSSLQADAEFLEETALEKIKFLKGAGSIPAGFLKSLHPAIRIRVLRHYLSEKLGHDFVPNRDFTERLDSELMKHDTAKRMIPVAGDYFLKLQNSRLTLHKQTEPAGTIKSVEWKWKENPELKWGEFTLKAETVDKLGIRNYELRITDTILTADKTRNAKTGQTSPIQPSIHCPLSTVNCQLSTNLVCFDANLIPDILTVRQWKDGDRMIPFGNTESVRLKKIFHNSRTPEEERKGIPLLSLGSGLILWLCGIRRSSFAPVSVSASKILILSIKKNSN